MTKYHYLAIDFGDSYVGLAVSNGSLAKPLAVFKYPQQSYAKLRIYLLSVVQQFNPEVIVIGVPSNEKAAAKIIKIFSLFIFIEDELKNRIVWSNEDYSTQEAILLKKRKRMREDSIAASIILENYFVNNNIRQEKNNIYE